MIKKIITLFFCFYVVNIFAQQPILVFDGHPQQILPENFRTSTDTLLGKNVSIDGLKELNIIGSDQFSEAQLKHVLKLIPHKIIIVDLRQESHGFINGIPISWYGAKNWLNIGLLDAQILLLQNKLFDDIKLKKTVTVYHITKKTEKDDILESIPATINVQTVYDEQQLAHKYNLQYQRFFISDHSAPSQYELYRFLQFVDSVPNGTWVYFHCRAGKGRTTVFMAMYDMLRNAKNVSFADILRRQRLLGGKDLSLLPAKSSYKYILAKQTLQFLKDFYQYARKD